MSDKELKLKKAHAAVNSQAWIEFEAWLKLELQEVYERLAYIVNIEEIYRTQGQIRAFTQLLKLRDNTNRETKVINGRKNR